MVKASIKLQNDQKLLLKNNENKAPPEKWYRYIQTAYPEKWDEFIQTIINTSTGSDPKEHCKRNENRRLIVNIYHNKIIFQKKKPVLYSSVYLCTRLAYLYHATIECSVSRCYDMIWNHTAVSTSLFTDFPLKNFFNGHHCFSKYIADEKRICRVKFSSL